MDKQLRDRVQRKLLKDERYLRIAEAFRKFPHFRLPFDEFKDELSLMHKQRTLGTLKAGSPNFVKKLHNSIINDHAFRSRATEILTECAKVRSSLSKMLEAFENYVTHEYSNDLKSLRTKDERKTFIRVALEAFYTYLTDAEEMVEICRLYIDNIDKGGYAVRELVESLKIISKFDPT